MLAHWLEPITIFRANAVEFEYTEAAPRETKPSNSAAVGSAESVVPSTVALATKIEFT